MLKRLRIKIVATVMAISFLVLLLALAAIVATACSSAYKIPRAELVGAVQRGPESSLAIVIGQRQPPPGAEPTRAGMTPVAVASVSDTGNVFQCNDTYLLMDEALRAEALARTLNAAHDEGILYDLGLFYYRSTYNEATVVAFADASSFVQTVYGVAAGAAGVMACSLAVLFALSLWLSHVITRPVQEAWEQQTEFIADASHELKTPLTVILANSDILASRAGQLEPDQAKWVGGIQDEARHMKGLVEELLFLARNDEEAQGGENWRTEVDFSDITRQVCLAFDAVAFEAGVELVEKIDANVTLRADRTQLERLARSLVENAIKYAGPSGRVTVTLDTGKKGRATLGVNNTGTPIPPEDLPRVFDRFWRCDQARSRTQTGSYGLGLAIAKSVAESQGGSISVASDKKDGTTFTVVF